MKNFEDILLNVDETLTQEYEAKSEILKSIEHEADFKPETLKYGNLATDNTVGFW